VRCTSRSLFFFQAEDGIRDSSVTGVQTCALPISRISAPLQKKLVAEMRGRIKEDDSSVPAPDGPFAYLRKFREGGQHEMYGRTPRQGGDVAIVLDGDALAGGEKYFKFGGSRHSPDHKLQAWSADTK